MKKTSIRKCILCLALTALTVLAVACISNAAVVQPVSYTGGTGEQNWADATGTKLTDGVIGTDDYADGSWIGWIGDPVMIFDFGSTVDFTGASVQGLNRQDAGIVVIKGVDLTFSNDGINFGNAQHFESTYAQYATIPGSQPITGVFDASGQYVKMTFTRWGPGSWAFLSEVSFEGTQTPVPEPGTLVVLVTGLTGLAGCALRRRR